MFTLEVEKQQWGKSSSEKANTTGTQVHKYISTDKNSIKTHELPWSLSHLCFQRTLVP